MILGLLYYLGKEERNAENMDIDKICYRVKLE